MKTRYPLTGVFALWLSAVANMSAAVLHVDVNSATPIPPYSDWSAAARTIQDAVDFAAPGDQILVTNGIYRTGSRLGTGTSRVALTKTLLVQSVNGPGLTVIEGYQEPGITNGPKAIRCVYMTNDAVLSGFTLTNGGTYGPTSDGGGVYLRPGSVVSNCIITGNSSGSSGGGAFGWPGARLENCILRGNTVFGNNSSGGGACGGLVLTNCLVISNSASYRGGGVDGGQFNFARLVNCTVVGNSVYSTNGFGGGVASANLYNSIVYYNTAQTPDTENHWFSRLYFSCTSPSVSPSVSPFLTRSISNAPQFVNLAGGDFRLQSTSPCINTGHNAYAPPDLDLDGNTRIAGGTVDIGAYEIQSPSSTISYAWLQNYGLSVDGSADYLDTDGDQMNNWQEWIADTLPQDQDSALRILSVTNDGIGILITWQSIPTRSYSVERGTNAEDPGSFSLVMTNGFGTGTFTDEEATGSGLFFYRVVVHR